MDRQFYLILETFSFTLGFCVLEDKYMSSKYLYEKDFFCQFEKLQAFHTMDILQGQQRLLPTFDLRWHVSTIVHGYK